MSEDTRILDALRRFGVQVVTASEDGSQLRLTARVPPNSSAQWTLCRHQLLLRAAVAPWKADISKMYFVRDGRQFYIWRIIFQGPYRENTQDVVNTITSTPRAKSEVKEIQLVGSRGTYQYGKGAQSIAGDEGVPAIAQIAVSRLRGG